jgi:hypothetical protein
MAFLRDDQDALAAAALNQLGGQDAGFQRLAQAHRVGNQDAGARLAQRLQRGSSWYGTRFITRGGRGGSCRHWPRCGGAGFPGTSSVALNRWGSYRHQDGGGRVEDFDRSFKLGEEKARTGRVPGQIRRRR